MFETFGTEEWVVALILTAILVVLVAIVVYRKRQEAETDIFLGDLTGDDISIILTGTITQKDLQKTKAS